MDESLVLTFRVDLEDEDDLQGFLMVTLDVQGIEERNDGLIDVYIPADDWTEESKHAVQQFAHSRKSVELLEVRPMEVKDWNAEWEASIDPVRVTDEVVITPSWKLDKASSLQAKHTLIIDPKMSFGTGHHETTRLCMRAIEKIETQDAIIADIGTGSGVLAFYALQRGGARAVAIDTDQWSIDNVKENQALNHISDDVFDLRKGELEATIAKNESFDVIIANIHRNVLMSIAEGIASRCQPGAYVILSGLLIYDGEEVRAKYEEAGLTFIEQLQENEWISIILRNESV
ncbi:MAG TPA: 50S ribosomal protein L11 methyltransferase [Candidatus Kapabacteria bacterium]|nr:50S ribosomal protein L11 methyltransferase [Candidatus Kapabacteria bacterium]